MTDFTQFARRLCDRILNLEGAKCGMPFVPDGYDLETGRPLESDSGQIICNLASQQILMRTLTGLSALTGDRSYQRRALTITRHFLRSYQNPRTGLLPWGGHMFLDLRTGEPASSCPGNPTKFHELKFHFPYYELMWKADAPRTLRFLEGFWRGHVWNQRTLWFSRHGDLERGICRVRGEVPLTFINTGSDLIASAAFAYARSSKRGQLTRAKRLAAMFDNARDPNTGLGAYQINRRPDGPEEVQLGHLGVSSLNLMPYAYAVMQNAVCQMVVSQLLGPKEGVPFLDSARRVLLAYGRYGYDPSDGGFHAMLRTDTGQRIKRAQVKDHGGAFARDYWPAYKFARNQNLGQMLYAYAMALRLTGDDGLRPTLDRLIRLLGVNRGGAWPGRGVSLPTLTTWDVAFVIQGLLELAECDDKESHLRTATRVADWSLARFTRDGWLLSWKGIRKVRFNQRLLLALLRLAAACEGKSGIIPTDWAGTEGLLDWKPRDRYGLPWLMPRRKFTGFM